MYILHSRTPIIANKNNTVLHKKAIIHMKIHLHVHIIPLQWTQNNKSPYLEGIEKPRTASDTIIKFILATLKTLYMIVEVMARNQNAFHYLSGSFHISVEVDFVSQCDICTQMLVHVYFEVSQYKIC